MRRTLYRMTVIVALLGLATGATPRPLAAECPTLTINCSENLVCADEPTTFTATLNGDDPNIKSTFNWTLSAGTITSGQGTSSITVDVTGLSGQSVTATVEVNDVTAMTTACPQIASCLKRIGSGCINHRKFDEYGEILFEKETERLDHFAIQLKNETSAQGFIIVYGGFSARRGDAEARANRSKDYLVDKHDIEADRIVIVPGGNLEESTIELWICWPGKYRPEANRTDATPPFEP